MSDVNVMPIDLNEIVIEETITEEDIAAAQPKNSGFAPIGKFHSTCTQVEGLSILPYSNPPCVGVKLIWTTNYAVELQDTNNPKKNIPVDRKTGDLYAGMIIKEDFGLFTPGEPERNKKRRTLIATEFKLCKPGEAIKPAKFYEIQGKSAIIDNCMAQKLNKETKVWEDTEYTKVGKFGSCGYRYLSEEMPIETPAEPATDIDVNDI